MLVGLPQSTLEIPEPAKNVVFKSLTLRTVHGRRIWDTWESCEALVADGKVRPEEIVSHEFAMSDWERAFDVLMSGQCCKIVMDPQK